MLESIEDYIKLEDCFHQGFYFVLSRNFYFGVYNENDKSFYGIRFKFMDSFLSPEVHWDYDDKYGTVKPLEFIKKCPINIDDIDSKYNELFNWINKETKLFFDNKLKEMSEKFNVDIKELQWRNDRRIEWVCEHGVGHTIWSLHGDYIHGCDGCCGKFYKK